MTDDPTENDGVTEHAHQPETSFGCFTGDCPHETQAECDAALRAEFAAQEAELAALMRDAKTELHAAIGRMNAARVLAAPAPPTSRAGGRMWRTQAVAVFATSALIVGVVAGWRTLADLAGWPTWGWLAGALASVILLRAILARVGVE